MSREVNRDFRTRQFQVRDDVRPHQADDVGAHRVLEARVELLGHRRATHQVAALQDQHRLARLRQVGGADHPVVTGADDDDMAALRPAMPPGRSGNHIGTWPARPVR